MNDQLASQWPRPAVSESAGVSLEGAVSAQLIPMRALTATAESSMPRLWSPNAAANWSFLFTPVLGAALVRYNWLALGETEKARTATVWLVISVACLVAALFVNPKYAPGISFWLLVLWYSSSARPQAKFLRRRFGEDYPRRGWGAVLGLASLAALGYVALSVA